MLSTRESSRVRNSVKVDVNWPLFWQASSFSWSATTCSRAHTASEAASWSNGVLCLIGRETNWGRVHKHDRQSNSHTWWAERVANTCPRVAQLVNWCNVTACKCTQDEKHRNNRTPIKRSEDGMVKQESFQISKRRISFSHFKNHVL